MNSLTSRAESDLRRARSWAPMLVVAAVASGGFWLGILRHTSNGNLGLVAREESLSFGEIWETADFAWTLTLENPTSEAVSIESLEASCGCTSPKPNQLTIAPGSSAEVRLKIDFAPRTNENPSAAISDFAVHVTPKFRRGEAKLAGKGWSVHGRVRRALRPSERSIVFGRTSQLVQGGQMPSETVTATALQPLRRVEASCDPPLLSTAVERADADGLFQIRVTPRPNLPPGLFRPTVYLRPVTLEGERLPAIVVNVEGEILAPVIAIPDRVDFGRHEVGDTAGALVHLESPLGKSFRVDRVEVDDASDEPLRASDYDGRDRSLRLEKRFTRTGSYKAKARLSLHAEEGTPFELVLPIRGYAIETDVGGPSS